MLLSNLDWVILGLFFLIVLVIGWITSRKAGKSASEFFLAGRSMPWWLLGISMVATTFSADTPNLVTGFVREGGVSKNWAWWAFLITGMITVFQQITVYGAGDPTIMAGGMDVRAGSGIRKEKYAPR